MSHRSVLHDEWSTGVVHQLGGKADEGGDIAQCMQAVTRPARNRSLFLLFYATILDRFRRKYSFKCSTAAWCRDIFGEQSEEFPGSISLPPGGLGAKWPAEPNYEREWQNGE